jgi:hypothetical protein
MDTVFRSSENVYTITLNVKVNIQMLKVKVNNNELYLVQVT